VNRSKQRRRDGVGERDGAQDGGRREQHHLRHEDEPAAIDQVRERAAKSPSSNDGAVLAVCTSATISADGVSVAISQATTVVCVA
jgi:hypothetical protein